MNYELAKQLKDAGFPQPEEPNMGHFDSWTLHKTFGAVYVGDKHTIIRLFPGCVYAREYVYIPTLEELIDACGEDIESIIQRGNGEGDNWEARSKHERFNASTLIEAVSKLWLARQNRG